MPNHKFYYDKLHRQKSAWNVRGKGVYKVPRAPSQAQKQYISNLVAKLGDDCPKGFKNPEPATMTDAVEVIKVLMRACTALGIIPSNDAERKYDSAYEFRKRQAARHTAPGEIQSGED